MSLFVIGNRNKRHYMKAMIFAAGLGTRLRPLTDTMPKALVPVCGNPLLEHVSRKLMKAGIDDVVVNVHHFADMIEDWAAGQDWISDDERCGDGMRMRFSDERGELLETGGAILHARDLLNGCGSFLVHNVDIISNLDIPWFISRHRPDALATLLVSERKTSRYLLFDPDTMRLVGWTNVSTGQVRLADDSVEPGKCRMLAFSGIHILSEKVLDMMHDYAFRKGMYDQSAAPRFPIMDFYLDVCGNSTIYGVEAADLALLDVGKTGSIELAETLLKKIC
jgi:NDP-sugar pyrophosphorylase family protein